MSQKENFIYSSATCTQTKNGIIKVGCRRLYKSEKGVLEHYKYGYQPDSRGAAGGDPCCEPIAYGMLKGRLYRRGMTMRVDELRDHRGTFLLDHGLIKKEVDLLQGRVGKSIFVRHYWSPAITELRDRVFKALELLEPKVG